MLKNVLIMAVTVFLAVSTCFAGESARIGVSCTIPSIPGVNAPPFADDETSKTKDAASDSSKTGETNVEETESEVFVAKNVQEVKKTEIKLVENINSTERIATIYSR